MDNSNISPASAASPGRLARTLAASALALLLGGAQVMPAWAVPAQIPLLSRSENPAKPNVMFTFDDSGSMAWRFMPDAASWSTDNAIRWSTTFHPGDDDTFGNGGSGNGVQLIPTRPMVRSTAPTTPCATDTAFSDCRATDLISARMRSPAWNTVFYNPEIRYQPWYNSDGTQFPASSITVAWEDPNDRTVAKSVNLSGLQSIAATTYICRSAQGTIPNVTAAADRSRTAATCGPIAATTAHTAVNSTNCPIAGGTWNTPTSNRCNFTTSIIAQANCTSGSPGNWGTGTSFSNSRCAIAAMTQNYCNLLTGGQGTWNSSTSTCTTNNETFAPATYYEHMGGALDDSYNYRRVRIMDSSSFTRGLGRTDCTLSGSVRTCTQAQEYQNFANWFTYYRTRNYLAIAASSKAFSAQGNQLRIGYGRINKAAAAVDGVSTATVQRGVRTFTGADRTSFFTWLHDVPASGGTPLRRAMDDVGKYYQRADGTGPWANTPGTNDGTPVSGFLQCRKSYHILMTDGFWNGDAANSTISGSNVDNVTGPTVTGPSGQTYKYVKARPYQDASDSTTSTLADVAMYYWNRDLQPNIENRVKPDSKNPGFWQHMVNFTVGLGVGGTLSYPNDLAAITAGTKNWPAPSNDSPSAVDDLWHAAVNSRGEYLSAKDPDEFAASLASILNEITIRNASEGGVAATAATLQAGNRKYVPEYKTAVWTGNVTAYELDEFGQQLSAVWNAQSALPAHGSRNIYAGTRNGTPTAEPFTTTGLSAALKAEIPGVNDSLINYLRGDAANEGGLYRERPARLGDFVNSQPVYVKSLVNQRYNDLPVGTDGRTTYKTFLNSKATRPGVLFIGGNDGMLHAFSDTNGAEIFGFIPRILLPFLPALASTSYEHRFYVDGQLTESDAYIGGAWRNVLVGSTGAGARAIFALNVTSAYSGMNASNVMWELDSTTQPEIGYVMSQVEVGMTRNGTWVAVFGNGPDSASGTARLFVVNLQTGAVIKTIQVSSTTGNGLGGVRLIRDANEVIVGAYAGDLKGNVWKFDLVSSSSASWAVSFGGTPLYRAGATKPFVATPQFISHPLGGYMVLVGSGKLYEEGDQSNNDGQALYGLWDKQKLVINSTTGAVEWATITATDAEVLSSQLANHAFNATTISNSEGATFYTITTQPLNWLTQRGWTLPLTIVAGHRNLLTPTLVFGYVLFETMSPTASGVANACDDAAAGGSYNLLINPLNGNAPKVPFYDTNADGYVNASDANNVVGVKGVYDGKDVVLSQKPCLTPADCPDNGSGGSGSGCDPGKKFITVQSALGGSTGVCINLPAPERWWWRQIQQVPQ